MANMTGGEVHYLRKVKTGDYEHKEFGSRISWSADDGDSAEARTAMHERAASEAVRVVHERLGLKPIKPLAACGDHLPTQMTPPAINAVPMTVPALQEAGLSVTSIEHVDTPPVTVNLPKRQKKADPPAAVVEELVKREIKILADHGFTNEDLLGPTNGVAAPVTPSLPASAPTPAESDPLLGELETTLNQPAPVTEITNEDLTAAVHKKFGAGATDADRAKFPAFKLGLPKFAPQISAIAAEKRGEFLNWLSAL